MTYYDHSDRSQEYQLPSSASSIPVLSPEVIAHNYVNTLVSMGADDALIQAAEQAFSELEWEIGRPRLSGRFVLLVDGLRSSSTSHISEVYSEMALGAPIEAFSYSGMGHHYLPAHTDISIEHAAHILTEYLELSPRSEVVPIGFGSGAAIVVLGVGALLARKQKHVIEPTVRKILLVAPVIGSALRSDAGTRLTSPLMKQLFDPRSPESKLLNRELSEGFETICSAGIDVYVIYSPSDSIAPWPWPLELGQRTLPCLQTLALPAADGDTPPVTGEEAAALNQSVIRHPETVALVRRIIAQHTRPSDRG